MKARVAASVVLAVGVAIGTAGCGFLTPQDTTRINQSTSFGIEGDVGTVHIRNAYLVAEGKTASLVATFVNSGSSAKTLTMQPTGASGKTKSLDVPQGDPTVVGPDQHLQWDNLNAKPGSLQPIFFSYGGASGVTLKLPVLTSDFAINSTLTPSPVPTGTKTSAATPGATGTATAAPTGTATPSPTATPAG